MKEKKGLKFVEETHTYTYKKRILTSVTTLVNSFFPPFDVKTISKKIADGFKFRNQAKFKKGIYITALEKKKATQKWWKQDWINAANHGTITHAFLEDYITGKFKGTFSAETEERTKKKVRQGIGWLYSFVRDNPVKEIIPEARIFSEEDGLAGTIDLLIILEDGTVILGDWKTNKKITRKEIKKGNHELTKDIDASHVVKYGLQLATYKYILEKDYDLKVKSMLIIHLKEDDYEEIPADSSLTESYLNNLVVRMIKTNSEVENETNIIPKN